MHVCLVKNSHYIDLSESHSSFNFLKSYTRLQKYVANTATNLGLFTRPT